MGTTRATAALLGTALVVLGCTGGDAASDTPADLAEPSPTTDPTGGAPEAPRDRRPVTPDGRAPTTSPRTSSPLEEGGALDDAFDGEDPFAEDPDFACLTDDDLDDIEETIGAQARDETEQLIDQGRLERC